MNAETKENEKTQDNSQNNNEIINEILNKRSKQQRKSWFGQDKDKEMMHKSTQEFKEFSASEIIAEEENAEKK